MSGKVKYGDGKYDKEIAKIIKEWYVNYPEEDVVELANRISPMYEHIAKTFDDFRKFAKIVLKMEKK